VLYELRNGEPKLPATVVSIGYNTVRIKLDGFKSARNVSPIWLEPAK
jgi:hypothetical protein